LSTVSPRWLLCHTSTQMHAPNNQQADSTSTQTVNSGLTNVWSMHSILKRSWLYLPQWPQHWLTCPSPNFPPTSHGSVTLIGKSGMAPGLHWNFTVDPQSMMTVSPLLFLPVKLTCSNQWTPTWSLITLYSPSCLRRAPLCQPAASLYRTNYSNVVSRP